MRAIPSMYAAESELMTELDALRRSVAQDRRVRAAERRWSECMRSRGFEYPSPRSILARMDSAAVRGAVPPERARRHDAAAAASGVCEAAVGLDSTVAAVRIEKEGDFVRAHKATLERHLERLRRQQPLVDSLLAEPPRRD